MAEKNNFTDSLSFGIESTSEISGDDLFSAMEDSITGDPDKVKKIDVTDKKKKAKKQLKEEDIEEEDNQEEENNVISHENDKLLDFLDEDEGELDKDKIDEEKDKDKTNEEENEIEEDEEGEDDEEDNSFPTLAKELYKLGIFTVGEGEEEEEVTTGVELKNLFIKEQKKGAINILEGILSKHGEDKKEMFDSIILKGLDPKEYLERFVQIEDLKNIDLTDVDIQERVVREELKAQGWDKDDIDAEVERVKSYGDLESSSKRYHKSLLKRNESKLIEEKRNKELQEQEEIDRDNEYKSNITAIMNAKLKEKEFDGIPVTPELANKTLDSIYTKKWRLPSGETITDFDNKILRLKRPENHALKVKMGLIMELLETDPTLSTIRKKAVSNESDEIFKDLEKRRVKKQSSIKREKPSGITSWFS